VYKSGIELYLMTVMRTLGIVSPASNAITAFLRALAHVIIKNDETYSIKIIVTQSMRRYILFYNQAVYLYSLDFGRNFRIFQIFTNFFLLHDSSLLRGD
jgi:hypothetical protein